MKKLLTTKELRTKKPAELAAYVQELKKEYTTLVEQLQTGKIKTTHSLKAVKRSIATALTILHQASAVAPTTKEKK